MVVTFLIAASVQERGNQMICKKCGKMNAPAKRCCSHCGSFLEGYTVNNVTGEYGYRGGDGGWYKNEQEYLNKIKAQ